jgi:hypothetical protein
MTRLQRRAPQASAITPTHVAWLFLLPVVVITVTAGMLAPLLARWVLPSATWHALPTVESFKLIAPEPDEQMRYLVGLGSVILLVLCVGLAWKQLSGLRPRQRLLRTVVATQVGGVALAAASLYQHAVPPLVLGLGRPGFLGHRRRALAGGLARARAPVAHQARLRGALVAQSLGGNGGGPWCWSW